MGFKLLTILLFLFILNKVENKCRSGFLQICDKLSDVTTCNNWRKLLIQSDGTDFEKISKQFANCTDLEELNIVGALNELNGYAFNELPKLQILGLWNNKLTNLPKNAFSGFVGLEKLILVNNEIEKIQIGCFERSNINHIDLSNNKLTRLTIGQLNIPNLKLLQLSNNSLVDLDVRCFGDDLQHLDLSLNRLELINVAVFSNLQNLKLMNLSGNDLRHIVRIPKMSKLETLDLSKNHIMDTAEDAFVDLPELRHLYINYNKLFNVYSTSFPKHSKITTLHLHWNYLTGVYYNLGENLTNLKEITLGGNPWECLCLQHILKFLTTYEVSSPQCDEDFFNSGLSAICIVADVKHCNGSSFIGDENDALVFRNQIQKYEC